ncbi:unnamed protein product [Paramecium sonneborni]|uniref:Uncharacterized protein n=1 Tax=Paramecium sonneborni TaxID=65129 RepID=A0A8S1RT40_9CILI|nr:unnamed protein product [Paramecium sonneborni]
MSQRMDISLIFLREISKDLKSIKSSVDQILQSVKGIEDDVRRLSGKNYIELLQIRKEKILKQKQEAELDQVHIQIANQEYDPITGKKKESINGEKLMNFYGVRVKAKKMLCYQKEKQVQAKSRASRNIEEFLWLNDTIFPQWIPIYVSLPSLKDPTHNLLEQALESQNYNFDKIQIREFKEALFNGNLKVIFILESYDEMKLECIQSNLYQTNKLAQDLNLQIPGQNVKFIITTREEILTSIGYQTWFYGKSIETLKEVEILPFTQEQSSEYMRQYCEVSVKRAIKRFYEFFKQLRGQYGILQKNILAQQLIKNKIRIFYSITKNVDQIIIKLQAIEFFNHIRTDQMISLKKELLKLWCQQKFITVIKNVNINHFMSTPFMMELIVYMLPKLSLIFSESKYLRDTLKKIIFKVKKRRQFSYKQSTEIQLETLDIIELQQQQVESQNFLVQFQALENELDNQHFFENFSMDHSIEFYGINKIITRQVFNVTKDANFIVGAFKLNQFTAYDFYETFVSFYHIRQLQNQKELGKTFNYETTLNDLQDFSLYLALDMTTNQLTQENYSQHYFDENQSNSEYCNFLKKCILLSSKGSIYTFNHKSIQEFFVAKYILNLLQAMFQEQDESIVRRNFYNSRFNANQFNISKDHYSGSIELLKPKLNSIFNIKNKLLQITQLSKQHNQQELIRTESNTIYLLSTLQENLSKIDLSNVILSDTKLNNLTFFNSNLNNTKFKNISIESCNFNCATIEDSQWENIICKEKQTLIVYFSQKMERNQYQGVKMVQFIFGKYKGMKKQKLFNFQKIKKSFLLHILKNKIFLACLTTQSIQLLKLDDPFVLEKLVPLQNYKYLNIKISHDGQYIAAQNNDSANFIWKREALQINPNSQNYQLKFSSTIRCTQVSHNSKLLAICGSDIVILSIRGFKDYQEITKLLFKPYSLAFSNDDQVLAAQVDQDIINFWSLKKINNVELLISISVKGTVNKLLYSYDNKYLLCRTNYKIYLYETTKEQYALESGKKQVFLNLQTLILILQRILIILQFVLLMGPLQNNQTIIKQYKHWRSNRPVIQFYIINWMIY